MVSFFRRCWRFYWTYLYGTDDSHSLAVRGTQDNGRLAFARMAVAPKITADSHSLDEPWHPFLQIFVN